MVSFKHYLKYCFLDVAKSRELNEDINPQIVVVIRVVKWKLCKSSWSFLLENYIYIFLYYYFNFSCFHSIKLISDSSHHQHKARIIFQFPNRFIQFISYVFFFYHSLNAFFYHYFMFNISHQTIHAAYIWSLHKSLIYILFNFIFIQRFHETNTILLKWNHLTWILMLLSLFAYATEILKFC